MKYEQPLRYEENIPAPFWLIAILVTSLTALVAALITVGIASNADWRLVAWYYPLMFVAGGLLLAFTLSFRRLRIETSDSTVNISFGFLRKTLPLSKISSCEVQKYRWLTYGGWGIRVATGGRRAWSMPGVTGGVEFVVTEDTKERRYFVSSRSPELLTAAVRAR
jgi:hypothetical protein